MMKRIFPTTVGVLLAVWSFGAIAAYAHQPAPVATAAVAQVRSDDRATPTAVQPAAPRAEADDAGD